MVQQQDEEDYYQKYLEYKEKYEELKKQAKFFIKKQNLSII